MNQPLPPELLPYLDKLIDAGEAAYGPGGRVVMVLMAIIIIIMALACVALWVASREDRKRAEDRADVLHREDKEDTGKLITTLGELAALIRALPAQSQFTTQILTHLMEILTLLGKHHEKDSPPGTGR